MSLLSRADGFIVSDLPANSYVLAEHEPRRSADGWDDWRGTYFRRGSLSDTQAATDWPIGSKLSGSHIGSADLWVQGVGSKCVGPGLYQIDVSAKGLLAARAVVVGYGAAAQQQSVEPVTIGGTTYAKAEVSESDVTATVRYISTSPPTVDVGTEKTPPNAPAVRPSGWTSLAEPVLNFPNGWVLMGSEADPLPGVSPQIYLVTDSYQFKYEFIPG